MSFQLRQYQHDIIDETRALMRQGVKSILIQLPTGGGKTLLTAHMLNTAASRGFASWFIVHRRELVKQTITAFNDIGIKRFGVVSAGFPEAKGHPIQICSIQTLIRRHTRLRQPKFIAWDECHHCSAGTWSRVYQAHPQSYHVGLTATPQRLDGTGLRKYFSNIVYGPAMPWLIDNGYLVPYKLYAPSTVNLSTVHTAMGDYVRSELATLFDKPTITGDAIKHYQSLAPGKRAVVFCVSIEHSKHVVDNFKKSGIPAAHVDGETPVDERDLQIRRFKNGEIKVLSNVELFGEGFDLPALEVAILLRPTQSLGLYLQQVGRALRPSPGKRNAIILDHAGNCQRHGLPDDEREWSLDGRDKKRNSDQAVSVKVCPKCFAAQYAGAPSCKFCGYEYDKQSRDVNEREGTLIEVDLKSARIKKSIEQSGAKTKDALIEIAVKRGYKYPERWAHHVWQARQAKKLQGVADERS